MKKKKHDCPSIDIPPLSDQDCQPDQPHLKYNFSFDFENKICLRNGFKYGEIVNHDEKNKVIIVSVYLPYFKTYQKITFQYR